MSSTVTALKLQKGNQQRVNVYLDGEFAFGLARIVAAWLQVGQVLDDDKIRALQAQDAREAAYQRAIKFLALRPRSGAEVRQNLEKHAVSPAVIVDVLERLQRSGLLDDARFAQMWVENRGDFRPRSRRALVRELRQRGVSGEDIEPALTGLDDETLAYQAAKDHLPKLGDLDRESFRRRLSGFLARRGFDYDIIREVVENVWREARSARG